MNRNISMSLIVTGLVLSVIVKGEDKAFVFGANYTGDLVSNLKGGIKTGTTYLGMMTATADFSTENGGLWKGGETFVKIANTHGGEPTANLIGDFQGVSNIEAGNHTWLYELWYKQSFPSLSLVVGLQDFNVNFASSKYGALFSNSSFGVHSSIADNIPAPIFPVTALGVELQWEVNKDMQWNFAVFDGTPDDFDRNPYNIDWNISKKDGCLAATEFQYNRSLIHSREGSYKLGVYYHQNETDQNQMKQNYGFYLVADQQLCNQLSVFSQIGITPRAINLHNHFYSLGLNVNAPFRKRTDDVFGLAVAYAGIDGNNIGSETAFEATYKCQICKCIYIRPDLQFVLNPAGTDAKLPNAWVGFIRLGVEI